MAGSNRLNVEDVEVAMNKGGIIIQNSEDSCRKVATITRQENATRKVDFLDQLADILEDIAKVDKELGEAHQNLKRALQTYFEEFAQVQGKF